MRRGRQSITLRLTLLFTAISTAVLLALGLLIGNAVEQHFVKEDMELITGKLRLVGNLLEKVQTSADFSTLAGQLNNSLVGHHGLAMLVRGPDGRTLFATADTHFPSTMLASEAIGRTPRPQVWRQNGPAGSEPRRGVVTLLATGIANAPPVLVAIGVDITHHEQFMSSFRRTLWLIVAIAAFLAGLLGWAAVKRGLAPLQAIREGAAAVTASRLDYRLAVDSVPVELEALAQTLNDMLARLEDSFKRLKDFSSDLAHELRTPVSNLMTGTQVALARARSVDEYREILVSNQEEYERMARMIGDILFLAEADNGMIVPNREPVELADEVRQLFDFFEALADEKSLHLSTEGCARVLGDKLMLRRAIANLLSNAIRHTPAGGGIQVRIGQNGAGTTLAVENTGEPIAMEHLPRIFDRFYRADPSRPRGEGAGLGLAITRSIIRAHGGEISARSTLEGVCIEIMMGSIGTGGPLAA